MPREKRLRVVEGSAKVEKFFVGSREFTQLSDHYGSSVVLEYLLKSSIINDEDEEALSEADLSQKVHRSNPPPGKVVDLEWICVMVILQK